jgi:transcriptional regulator with XRE-family HTH domain
VALEQRLIHEAPRVIESDSGRRREYLGLVPGAPPARPYPRRDRASELVDELAGSVSDRPGRTMTELAAEPRLNINLVRAALAAAARTGQLHARYNAASNGGGPLRREWWPGPPTRSSLRRSLTAAKLRAELEHRAASTEQLAQTLGVARGTVQAWLRSVVPAARVPQVREWLAATPHVSEEERDQAARGAIPQVAARWPGLSRAQLSWRLPVRHRRRLGRALDQALDAGEVYYRPHPENPSRLGLYPAPVPSELRPGAAVTGAQLLSLRERKRWSQRELARRIGVGAARVCTWEKHPQDAIARGWWARVHQIERLPPAEPPVPPPDPRLLAKRVRRRRTDRGWDREELALRAGVSLSTVRRLETPDPRRASGLQTVRRVMRALDAPPGPHKQRSGAEVSWVS